MIKRMNNRPLRSVNEKFEAQWMQIGDISPAQICRHLSYNYMAVFVSRWVVYLLDISRCLMFSGYSRFWLSNNLGGQARISRMTSSAWCISRLTSLVPTKWRLLPRVAWCDVSIRPYGIIVFCCRWDSLYFSIDERTMEIIYAIVGLFTQCLSIRIRFL